VGQVGGTVEHSIGKKTPLGKDKKKRRMWLRQTHKKTSKLVVVNFA